MLDQKYRASSAFAILRYSIGENMKLSTFKITTMNLESVEVEALTHSQAITIWKSLNTKELFKSCNKVKDSKEIKRYWELRELVLTDKGTKENLTELKKLCNDIREDVNFKKFKKFESFKMEPKAD